MGGAQEWLNHRCSLGILRSFGGLHLTIGALNPFHVKVALLSGWEEGGEGKRGVSNQL